MVRIDPEAPAENGAGSASLVATLSSKLLGGTLAGMAADHGSTSGPRPSHQIRRAHERVSARGERPGFRGNARLSARLTSPRQHEALCGMVARSHERPRRDVRKAHLLTGAL